MNEFGPIMTAMVTPFDEMNQVNVQLIRKLVLHLIKEQSTSLVVTGTTGEAQSLTALERLRVWETVVEFIGGEMPVVAGVGTNNTKTTVHNAKLAEEAGVDALLIVTPYYVKPTQAGLLAHYQTVARSTSLPIILYNVPSRTGVDLSIETIQALSCCENIIGIKEAGGGIERLKLLKQSLPESFLIFTGEDSLYCEALALGCAGVISVSSHVIGKQMAKIHAFIQDDQLQAAVELNELLKTVYEGVFIQSNPIPIKALLNECKIEVGELRLPLIAMKPYEQKELYEQLKPIIELTV